MRGATLSIQEVRDLFQGRAQVSFYLFDWQPPDPSLRRIADPTPGSREWLLERGVAVGIYPPSLLPVVWGSDVMPYAPPHRAVLSRRGAGWQLLEVVWSAGQVADESWH